MKLNKSLAALEAAADELLKKSQTADDSDEDVKPDDVSDDSADDGDDEDIEKCDNPDGDIKKSASDEGDGGESDDAEDDDDGDDDESDDDEDEDIEKSLEDTQKAIQSDFEADADIAKSIESSEFTAAVVATLVKSLSEVQYDVNQSKKSANATSAILAKSLQASLMTNQKLMSENEKLVRRVNKLEKSMNIGFDKILDSLDSIGSTPAYTRKSVASISVQDKNFQKSLGNNAGGFESLSKGQILNVLSQELYQGNPAITANDIVSYESGAPLRPEIQALVVNKCKN